MALHLILIISKGNFCLSSEGFYGTIITPRPGLHRRLSYVVTLLKRSFAKGSLLPNQSISLTFYCAYLSISPWPGVPGSVTTSLELALEGQSSPAASCGGSCSKILESKIPSSCNQNMWMHYNVHWTPNMQQDVPRAASMN